MIMCSNGSFSNDVADQERSDLLSNEEINDFIGGKVMSNSSDFNDDDDSLDPDDTSGDPYYIWYNSKINAGHPKSCTRLLFLDDGDAYDFTSYAERWFVNNCRLGLSKSLRWFNEGAYELPSGYVPVDECAVRFRLVFPEVEGGQTAYQVSYFWLYHLDPVKVQSQMGLICEWISRFVVSESGISPVLVEGVEIRHIKV